MKKVLCIAVAIVMQFYSIAQNKSKPTKESILKELSASACNCVDSIKVYNKSRQEVIDAINKCINARVGAYQLSSKLFATNALKDAVENEDGKKEVNISINVNENSDEYKKYYYEVEKYMMDNCAALKEKVATNEKQSSKSFSDNPKALDFYNKGLDEAKKENHQKAIQYFEKAVKADPEFAFAWDNMGIAYRRLDNYDKALESYEKSLSIDPYGLMPLQNIAVVYQYKKEYKKAIEAYEKLAKLDSTNPEVYYGIGQLYATAFQDFENGLKNMCKAYSLYIEQKSPYRTDAEKIINIIYGEMKKQGKEDRFKAILKENHISPK